MNAQTQPDASTAVALRPPSMPMPPDVVSEFGLTITEWRVLVDQIFPNAKSSEAVAMALSYCRARKLDIYKRPVHIVPMYSSALKREVETVWPGIAEIRTTAARTGEYAGIDAVEFGPMIEREFVGEKDRWENRQKVGVDKVTRTVRFPEWASVVVYRWVKGEKAAFHTKIYWEETCATVGKTGVPNDMWSKRPRGQFDKCLEAAALRKAFPEEVGSMYAAEEMEGRVIDHDDSHRVERIAPPTPPSPPMPPSAAVSSGPPSPPKVGDARSPIADNGIDRDEDDVRDGFDLDTFLSDLDVSMSAGKTEDEIIEIWDGHDVEATLTGDEIALQRAFNLRRKRLDAVLEEAR